MNSYPNWFFPSLLIIFLILISTGVMLIPTSLDTRFEIDVFWRLMGDEQLMAVSSHNMSAYIMMLFVGALTTLHSRVGLKRRRNVKTGILLLALFGILLLSGIGLLYLGNEVMILSSCTIHIVAGVIIGLFLIVHYGLAKLTKQP